MWRNVRLHATLHEVKWKLCDIVSEDVRDIFDGNPLTRNPVAMLLAAADANGVRYSFMNFLAPFDKVNRR